VALRLNTSEKNEIMPRRKARAEKPRLAQMLLRSGSLAGVESNPISNGMDLPCYRTKSMTDHYTLETFNTDTVSKSR